MAASDTLRWVALSFCALSLSAGCTRMLGIDGKYVQGQVSSGGAGAEDGAGGDDTGDGGDMGTGGDEPGTGGVDSGLSPGAGGDVGAGGAAGAAGAGGVTTAGGTGNGEAGAVSGGNGGCGTSCPPPPRTACSAGLYTGTIRGKHSPSVTFVGVPLDVMGSLSFSVTPTDAGDVARIEDGTLTGTVGVAGSPPFVATLTGTVNCASGHLEGVITGGFALTPSTAPILKFDGTHAGTFSNGRFNGTWEESEVVMVGNTRPYKGNGTWSADVSTP